MVHHETTTGLINPVKEIADVVASQNRVFILDAVSALAGETAGYCRVSKSIWWRAQQENVFRDSQACPSCSSARDFWSG